MLAFVATVALLNLMLGMGMAIVVSHETADLKKMFRSLPIPFLKRKGTAGNESTHSPETIHSAHGDHASADRHAEPERKNFGLDIPDPWGAMLKASKVHPQTSFEAVLLCLRLQLTSFQPSLTTCEKTLRALGSQPAREALIAQLEQLKQVVEPWKVWANETAAWVTVHHDSLRIAESFAIEIEEKLLDRVTHAKNVLRLAASCAEEAKTEAVLRALLNEINRDLEGTHLLIDRMLDLLAMSLAGEQRADELPLDWQNDAATGLYNRCGLESIMCEWKRNDPQQKRLLSGLFVECDRLGKLNERFGTACGDQIFTSFAKIVNEAVRLDRGDKAVRISGAVVGILLADTGAAGARFAAERIRQLIEATTFQVGAEELTLAANCAVTEFMLDDKLPEVLRRLQEGIKEAKKAGRNRTAIDEGDGPKVFDALPMTVKGRVVRVGEEEPATTT